jgi:predicted short-subunit dehydrogenase-like oxidoreductase (DUF2520 family)
MNDDAAFDDASPSPVALVGAGAVGTALARRLAERGVPVQAILSRDPADAQALAERVGAPVAAKAWSALPSTVRLVLLCVPDDALAAVAGALADVAHPWETTLVGHTAGGQTADVLAPLVREGAATLSFHPLQTFTPDTSPDAFDDIVIGIEGDPEAVAAGTALARTLGARPVVLSARGKALYHCAAALASNGLVALMAVVEELLAAADVEGEEASAAALMAPLVEQTWAHLQSAPPEGALTGPVARGDEDTVAAHLDALRDHAPHLLPLYAALSTEMVRVAVRGGQLDGTTAEDVLRMLQKTLQSSSDEGASFGSSH